MFNKYRYPVSIFLLTVLSLIFTTACDDERVTRPDCVLNEQGVTCNGGYSYWASPLYASKGDVVAITGVIRNNTNAKRLI